MANSTVTGVILELMDLHDAAQFTELQRQRILCGWGHSPSALEGWRAANVAKTQAMFWVVPPSLEELPAPQRYAGHFAMAKKTYENDNGEDDALPQMTVVDLQDLFILPEHRSGGLGRAAVRALEGLARIEPYGWPGCSVITLNTLARRYVEEDEWRAVAAEPYSRMNIELPAKGTSNEDWYGRMGYVKWKEVPLYSVVLEDGSEFKFAASYMWKPLAQ